jgi:septal ring factor EnvC (AmiA/AmiB activator)
MRITRHITRFAVALMSASALGATALVPISHGDVSSQISSQQSVAKRLSESIKHDDATIAVTSSGLTAARAHLASVEAKLSGRMKELKTVQTELMTARDQLARLEARLRLASNTLSTNLRAEYEQGSPNLVTVILNAHGFSQLLNQVNFAQRISREDAQIVGATRTARTRVLGETKRLGTLEQRDKTLTDQILSQRDQVARLETSLLHREIAEDSARSGARSKLAGVTATIGALRNKLAKIEAAAAARSRESIARQSEDVNQQVGGLAIDTAGMVQPPAGAPAAVAEMIAAGNAIATLPYIWGGGHGSFISPGYDCSGSVSYVLAAAGLLSSPETSDEFMSYGDAGDGSWVTIHATDGHVWMTIAGWRFDTVALAEDGTRWSQGGGEFGGYVDRHPPGL